MDQRIISLQIVQNWTLQIRKFTGIWKSLNRSRKIDEKSEPVDNKSEAQKIYKSMERMYTIAENPIINCGDISQLINRMLDSGATCRMTQDISDFIPGSLAEIYKYIEVADGHLFTAKKNRRSSNKNM